MTSVSRLRRHAAACALALIWAPLSAQNDSRATQNDPALAVDALAERVSALEEDTAAVEALRAVKRLQHAYGHYAELGLWEDLAGLFAEDAVMRLPAASVQGRDAIRAHFVGETGRGRLGLDDGRLNTELMLSPVVTLDAERTRARARWHRLSLTGSSDDASWSGGIQENEYVLDNGVWKIAVLDEHLQYAGAYETGWRNVKEEAAEDVAPVPFHYDVERAGTPVLERTASAGARAGVRADSNLDVAELARRFAVLERRIGDLNDAGLVQNVQHAYGFYVDRQMWDHVADLFADGATLELASGTGPVTGKGSIRRALEQLGSAGLQPGELNDHLQLQTIVTIAPGGQTAYARSSELTMTGVHGEGGALGVNVLESTFVKEDGIWRIASLRASPRMRSDYAVPWAEVAGDAPAIHFAHPVTRSAPQYPAGMGRPFDIAMLAPAAAAEPPATLEALARRVADAERRLAMALAYDGAENISNAYGYYIDEFLWHDMADAFAEDGWKELSYIGTYVGRERIRESTIRRYRTVGRRPNALVIHQKTQPVVSVSQDGQSARIRTRLFQINSSLGTAGSWLAGVYENHVVLENGVFKIAEMDLDYTWTAGYAAGWAFAEAGAQQRFAPSGASGGLADEYPPDRPLVGVTFAPYPDVAEMRFHYAHPVTGR